MINSDTYADRSLYTKDIEGAVPNTNLSRVVKNKERAKQIRERI
jgi:hypothetical protein